MDRVDFGDISTYCIAGHSRLTAPTNPGTFYSEPSTFHYNGSPLKVEPSEGEVSLDDFTRLVVTCIESCSSSVSSFSIQMQMSRDQEATYVDVGDPMEPFFANVATGAMAGTVKSHVHQLPSDLFTDSAAATDADDYAQIRMKIDTTVNAGSAPILFMAWLLPSVYASQAKPKRGNVFSGVQY